MPAIFRQVDHPVVLAGIPRYSSFGWAAARFDDVIDLAPAPISGLLLAAAAVFAKNGRPDRALVIMLRDGRKHHSPNAGWPESTSALHLYRLACLIEAGLLLRVWLTAHLTLSA